VTLLSELATRIMAMVTPFLALSIFTAILGMFQFGFNTGVVNAPEVSNSLNPIPNRQGYFFYQDITKCLKILC
jgi:flagellar biosynthesis protein FlhB